jgi:hypothetical protein
VVGPTPFRVGELAPTTRIQEAHAIDPKLGTFFAAGALALLAVSGAWAQVGDPIPGATPLGDESVRVELIAQLPDSGSGGKPLARPMILTGDGMGRVFVADQNGEVLQIHSDRSVSVFLDVASATPLLANQGQQGLSAFAFHPDYHEPGTPGYQKFYTASSQPTTSGTPDYPVPGAAPLSHHSVLHEWTVSADPDAIDPTSAREILRVAEPYGDHNMAQISFNPLSQIGSSDYGLLYVAMGDGGNVCCPRPSVDPHFTGQSLASPLGTILRIDPLQDTGGGTAYSIPVDNPFASDGDASTLGEIWAYGLRNPHRFSWDTGGTGRMLISDIGQANVEEIDLGQLGANYGWSEREGTFLVEHFNEDDVFPLPGNDATFGYTYPVIQYDHDEGDRAISGGYVYRGARSSPLYGEYVFGDLVSGRIFISPVALLTGASTQSYFEELRLIDHADGQEKSLLEMVGGGVPAPRADLRFGMDDAGSIYLLTKRDGSVRRLVPGPEPVPVLPAAGSWVLASLLLGFAIATIHRRRSAPARPWTA